MKTLVKDAITETESRKLGDMLSQRILKRTRLGYGVTTAGAQERLAGISDTYKVVRREYADRLSDATTPNRSNLTATGQMLDSMTVNPKRGAVEIEIKGRRTGELTGARSRLSNAEVARYVQKAGRPFFKATTAEKNFIIREAKQIILAKYKKSS